jgi:hypothetical protein
VDALTGTNNANDGSDQQVQSGDGIQANDNSDVNQQNAAGNMATQGGSIDNLTGPGNLVNDGSTLNDNDDTLTTYTGHNANDGGTVNDNDDTQNGNYNANDGGSVDHLSGTGQMANDGSYVNFADNGSNVFDGDINGFPLLGPALGAPNGLVDGIGGGPDFTFQANTGIMTDSIMGDHNTTFQNVGVGIGGGLSAALGVAPTTPGVGGFGDITNNQNTVVTGDNVNFNRLNSPEVAPPAAAQ